MNLYLTNPGTISPPNEISTRRIRNVDVAAFVSPVAPGFVFSSSTNQPCKRRPGAKLAPGLSLPTSSFFGGSVVGAGAGGGGAGGGSAARSTGSTAGGGGGSVADAIGALAGGAGGAGCALAEAANATSDKHVFSERSIALVIDRSRTSIEAKRTRPLLDRRVSRF